MHVNLGHGEMLVDYDTKKIQEDSIMKTLTDLGYTIRDRNKVKALDEAREELRLSKMKFLQSSILSLGALIVLILFKLIQMQGNILQVTIYVSIVLAFLNMFYVGLDILKMAFRSLRRGIFNQHVLMEFAALGAIAGGFLGFQFGYPAIPFFAIATFITTYHLLGAFLSTATRTQSDEALMGLMLLQPDTAHLVQGREVKDVDVTSIKVGDIVEVRAGEKMPLDGFVVSGNSAVDQSIVTGESIPVEKFPGNEVIGGSLNVNSVLRVRIIHTSEDSFVGMVVRTVKEARATKPGIIQLIDTILKYFVPLVLGSASLAFLVWLLVPYLRTGHIMIEAAIYYAVSALILGYPVHLECPHH